MTALEKQIGGNHYKDFAIQPVEFIHRNGIDFLSGNIIKYVCRWKAKGGISDLEKAKHYIELLIELSTNKGTEEIQEIKNIIYCEKYHHPIDDLGSCPCNPNIENIQIKKSCGCNCLVNKIWTGAWTDCPCKCHNEITDTERTCEWNRIFIEDKYIYRPFCKVQQISIIFELSKDFQYCPYCALKIEVIK